MMNGGDKSAWPDPVSPCCIFTVSQGIVATVTAHQPAEIKVLKEKESNGREEDIELRLTEDAS